MYMLPLPSLRRQVCKRQSPFFRGQETIPPFYLPIPIQLCKIVWVYEKLEEVIFFSGS